MPCVVWRGTVTGAAESATDVAGFCCAGAAFPATVLGVTLPAGVGAAAEVAPLFGVGVGAGAASGVR